MRFAPALCCFATLTLAACGSGGGSTTTATTGSGKSSGSKGSTSGSSGGTSFNVKPAFEYCTQPVFVEDNGDLGQPCTPNGAGLDAGQGSCGATEICVDYGAGPVCTANCANNAPCPGTSQCYPVALAGGASESLCMAACTFLDGGGCGSGQVCSPSTPNPSDPGACLPKCTSNAQCNSADAGTSSVCTASGLCQCTHDSDCNALPDAGLKCDTGSGTCYLPCSAKSPGCVADNFSFGCCAQEGQVSYCDLLLPQGGWQGGGITFDAGYCSPPAPPLDNQGVGQSCTPASGGTPGQGSCASSAQICQDVGFGPICTFDCSQGPCPGSSACLSVTASGQPAQRCLPACDGSPDGGCAAATVCLPQTPNPLDPGVCNTSQCSGDSDCNPAGSGTARVCRGGQCACTGPADCAFGQDCDPTSGVCFWPCGAANGIGCSGLQGCCAQMVQDDGGQVGYCDTLATLAPPGFSVGPHNPWPAVTNPESGPVLNAMHLVTVTFNPWKDDNALVSYPFQDQVESFGQWIVSSNWLAAVGSQYGIGPGTSESVRLAETPPTVVLDDSAHREVQAFVTAHIKSGVFPTPTAGNTLYVIYYPFTTTIVGAAGQQSCISYGGYHFFGTNGAQTYFYAVIPDCGNSGASGWNVDYSLQGVETAASHEIIEAATDPIPPSGGDPESGSYLMHNQTSPWALSALGDEVGDMCTNIANHWVDPVTGNLVQRTWSAQAARGNGSPCAPVLPNEPFADASGPLAPVSATAGTSVNVPWQAWSTVPVPSWNLVLFQLGGEAAVTVNPPVATVNNNQSGNFQVAIPMSYVTGQEIPMALVSLPTPEVDTEWWPVVITVK